MKDYLKNEELALEIAEALDDLDSLAFHRSCVHIYPEAYLRKQLASALAVPDHKVTTTRARIYTSLVKGNARKPRNPWS